MNDDDDHTPRPVPENDQRAPFGVWFLLGVGVIGVITLVVMS